MKKILDWFFPSKKADSDNLMQAFNEPLDHHQEMEFIDHGLQTIDVKNIIGSVGKYHDFDSKFRPKKHAAGHRFSGIKKAMREGKPLPPVNLYQIKNDYYVVDGNHRVAAAKELGQFEIRAKVVELLSTQKTMENLLYIENKKFYEFTDLPEKIEVTEVGQYRYLENQIYKHQKHMNHISGQEMVFKQAARDWYDTIYLPLTTIISNSQLMKYFPKRTLGDLFCYISYHHWDTVASRRYGIGIDRMIPRNMETFRQSMLEKNTPDYPEMIRTITAFILIDVNATTQMKIIDKLFALEEVQEVHSVHGTIDILVKIVLKRDLLASDAEIIADYVDKQIRKINGIARTQTVIPGASKVKEGFVY